MGVLAEWNEGYRLSDLVGPAELLAEWLDCRLDPAAGRTARYASATIRSAVSSTVTSELSSITHPAASSATPSVSSWS